MLRLWGVFDLFTWKYVSHHSSLQFLISHPTRWLRTHCFSEPTSRPSGVTQHRQNTVFCALCYSFVFVSLSLSRYLSLSLSLSLFSLTLHTLIFFLLAPSSLTLPTTVAASVQKSEIWIPNFLHLLLCGHFKPFKRACKHSVDWIFCLKKSNGHRHGKPIALSFRRKSSKL